MAEYNSGGTLLRRYVHGPGIDEPLVWYEGTTTTNKTWLYQDQLGSVIGTANSAGTSTAIHSYGPYGEPNIATGIRFRYTGQQFIGSLNLYYYKARFYSPALGRFLQTDPIGIADDLNLYAYVGNNPINFSDPSGLWGTVGAGWGGVAGIVSGSLTGYAQDGWRGAAIGAVTGGITGAGVGFVSPYAAASAGSRAAAAVTALAAGGANLAQQELTNNVYAKIDSQKVVPISGWNIAGAAVAGPFGAGTAKVITAFGKEVTNATASIFGATLPAMVPKVTLGTKAADALYAGSTGAMMDLVATGLSGGSGGVTGLNGGSGGVVAPFTTFSQLLNLGK